MAIWIEDVLQNNNGVMPTTSGQSKGAVAGDVNVPAANTAAVITYAAAGAGISHVLGAVYWSYSAAPTAGRLTILDGVATVLDVDITAAGPGHYLLQRALKGTANTAMTVTLAAGGGTTVGKINARHWTE